MRLFNRGKLFLFIRAEFAKTSLPILPLKEGWRYIDRRSALPLSLATAPSILSFFLVYFFPLCAMLLRSINEGGETEDKYTENKYEDSAMGKRNKSCNLKYSQPPRAHYREKHATLASCGRSNPGARADNIFAVGEKAAWAPSVTDGWKQRAEARHHFSARSAAGRARKMGVSAFVFRKLRATCVPAN